MGAEKADNRMNEGRKKRSVRLDLRMLSENPYTKRCNSQVKDTFSWKNNGEVTVGSFKT